jgi:peptide/nickel transport system ATP-binding protein
VFGREDAVLMRAIVRAKKDAEGAHDFTWQDDGSKRPLLSVTNLRLVLGSQRLLDDVTFSIGRSEVVGLVGESGSGKTLTGLSIIGLTPPGAQLDGSINFANSELLGVPQSVLRSLRGRRVSMIFQEPRASLNPAITIGRQIVDVIRVHDVAADKRVANATALGLLGQVGIPNPRASFASYPHELSGGMCQRVMIAMALSGNPTLLIADEPTTALDVTVQAQIVALLRSISDEHRLSILLISHNLAVVSDMCDRVVTMYCGQVVNADSTEQVVTEPTHPYTRALLMSAGFELSAAAGQDEEVEVAGQPASPTNPPSGCRYHPRCTFADERCLSTIPKLITLEGGGQTRCLRHEEIDLQVRSS